MKPLGQYSDQEFIDLVHEAGQLSYLEKVKLGFEKFGTVQGEESRDIEGTTYQFSLAPSSKEEQLERWHFYIERKSEIEYNKRITNYESQIKRAIEQKVAINSLIEQIENTFNSMDIYKTGRDMLQSGKSVDQHFINPKNLPEPMGFKNILIVNQQWVNKLAIGQALYKIQLKLKDELKELEEDSEKSNSDEWNYRSKLAFMYEIGVIDYLQEKYKLDNEKKKFAEFLEPILGDSDSNEFGKLLNNVSKSPLTPKAKDKIKKHLRKLGLPDKLNSESIKKKK